MRDDNSQLNSRFDEQAMSVSHVLISRGIRTDKIMLSPRFCRTLLLSPHPLSGGGSASTFTVAVKTFAVVRRLGSIVGTQRLTTFAKG